MLSLWMIAGYVGHAIAAALLAALTILTSRRSGKAGEEQLLVVALALTALWSLRHALGGVLNMGPLPDGVAETVRNGAWLAVLIGYLHRTPEAVRWRRGRPLLLVALGMLLMAQLGCDLLVGEGAPLHAELLPVFRTGWLLRCTFALGALIFLHSLSTRRDHPATARREAWVSAALAFMWAYDFNHYILAWFTDGQVASVGPMRGFVMALLAVMLTIGLRTDGTRPVALSRVATMRLVSVGALLLYVLVVVLLASLSTQIAAPFGRVVQFSVLFALAVSVLALMPSSALRSWLRVEVSKHLFAHRYDYRALWLRFAAMVDENGGGETPLDGRLARAIADAVEAPGAVLYLREPTGALAMAYDWNWPEQTDFAQPLAAGLARRLEQQSWIVDLQHDWGEFGALLPGWMQRSRRAWVLAPLIHREQIIGAILLARPVGGRTMDWEDLDVLRVVCGEAAARLSEARSREALAEAQRFDEFNRRFAFILHDIKNMVSQISLMASNAERHADNPAFRADLVLTLRETATRMTELLQRLGRPGSAQVQRAGLMLGAWARELAPGWAAGLGSVRVEGEVSMPVQADADGLSRALAHLVRNAIEASPATRAVRILIEREKGGAALHVIDQGDGMTADFLANDLFRPFSSTKTNGFGLGAHEARLLVQSMGGSMDVSSVPGEGTRFTIRLPFADMSEGMSPALQARKTG